MKGNGETLFTPRADVCRGPKNKLPLSKAADNEAAYARHIRTQAFSTKHPVDPRYTVKPPVVQLLVGIRIG